MSEQQSQKHGLRSSAQKEDRARDVEAPLPASNPVAGAHGKHQRATISDVDLSMELDESRQREKRDDK